MGFGSGSRSIPIVSNIRQDPGLSTRAVVLSFSKGALSTHRI